MRLGFYRRLTAEQKREYDRSDALAQVPLRPDPELGVAADRLIVALASGSPAAVARSGQDLLDRICDRLERTAGRRLVPPKLRVLRVRPRYTSGEFHGLYQHFPDGRPEIRLWMFTAAERRIVKPRTFLRTLLHELCHHLDMCWLGLPSSFHTLGFHARESSIVRALERSGATIPGGRGQGGATRAGPEVPARPKRRKIERRPAQLQLF